VGRCGRISGQSRGWHWSAHCCESTRSATTGDMQSRQARAYESAAKPCTGDCEEYERSDSVAADILLWGPRRKSPNETSAKQPTAVRRSLFGSHFAVDLPSRRSSVGAHSERLACVRKGVDADADESRPRLGCRRLQQCGTGPLTGGTSEWQNDGPTAA
jgi:hypothetical protein